MPVKTGSEQSSLTGKWSYSHDGGDKHPLDLFSTSPTKEDFGCEFPPDMLANRCDNSSPYFAYGITKGTYGITQGCCNSWACSRCGIIRAKQEYWRIVNGIKTLGEQTPIFFITITCRGSQIAKRDAEKNYLDWTNRFLDACRARCKRSSGLWCYVQVTERQKRGHPHSHILTTFDPMDTWEGRIKKWQTDKEGKKRYVTLEVLRSDWIQKQVTKSGLGEQYDISTVKTLAAASRYVAKYLFKEGALKTVWPKGWKRVRYSQNFPKETRPKSDAFILLSRADWQRLSQLAVVVKCADYATWQTASRELRHSDVLIH